MSKVLSVCIACYNEERNIESAYRSVTSILEGMDDYDYELIFADNASTDGSPCILKEIADKDHRVKVIFNMKNFGPSRSGTNCIFSAKGDAVIFLACDLQDPPELIPEMVSEWERGSLVVWGQKTSSEEKRKMYSIRSLYYRIIRSLSEIDIYPHVDGFGLYDQSVIKAAREYCSESRGMKTFVGEMGYRVTLLPYRQRERVGGESSYTIAKYCKLASAILVETSTKPLHMVMTAGAVCSLGGLVLCLGVLLFKLIRWEYVFADDAFIAALIALFGSLQLFAIGIVGVYVGCLKDKATVRPLVVERERLNFGDEG